MHPQAQKAIEEICELPDRFSLVSKPAVLEIIRRHFADVEGESELAKELREYIKTLPFASYTAPRVGRELDAILARHEAAKGAKP